MTTTTTTDPDAPVRTAARTVDEARQHLADLERRVAAGDAEVTATQLAEVRDNIRYAELRHEGATVTARKTRTEQRLAACNELREEIQTFADDSGQQLADLLKNAENAVTAFVTAARDRNTRIIGWERAMTTLGVPEHNNGLIPPAEHGNLGYAPHVGEILAGPRHIAKVNAGNLLARMLTGVRDALGGIPGFDVNVPGFNGRDALYKQLADLDRPRNIDTNNAVFYRGPNGAVIHTDKPYSDDDVRRLALTPISRKEAWGA